MRILGSKLNHQVGVHDIAQFLAYTTSTCDNGRGERGKGMKTVQ